MERKSKIVLLMLFVIVASCSSYWEQQEKHLLPKSYSLNERVTTESGITTFNQYKISNRIDKKDLVDFPQYGMEGREWKITKWHKPSEIEILNLKSFLKEKDNQDFSKVILDSLDKQDNYLIAYAYDIDDSNLSNENYEIHNWMDFYYLNIDKGKLMHISYGKF